MEISSLPDHEKCGDLKTARDEEPMMESYEELQKIEVIKSEGNNKCDFYRETQVNTDL